MYTLTDQYSGYSPIEAAVLSANVTASVASGFQPQGGFIATAYDRVWGGGEVIWARANGAIPLLQMVSFLPVWDSSARTYTWNATAVANTANLGRPVGVSMAQTALAAGDYGWFLIQGNTPVSGTASVAADTVFGITAAGQIGANSAGKQILNARVITPATNTVVTSGTGAAGDNFIYVTSTDGMFVGGYLSGTGVGAAAIISAIDPLGKYVKVTVVNSAAVAGSVTQTANNSTIFYNVVNLNRPFAQGAIT